MSRGPSLLLAALLLGAPACAAPRGESAGPLRTQMLDVPLQTSDGQVIGADRVPPEVKLGTGPTLGPGGVAPSERPGAHEGVEAKPEDPLCKTLPAGDPARKGRCPDAPLLVPR